MINARDAALYLISLDPDETYFNKKLITCNSHTFYEGNARLNKILHLAQNMYIGRTGYKLIDADFYAYDNGGIIPDIQENYAMLLGIKNKTPFVIDDSSALFLKKVFIMVKDAPIERLIEIDHEDPAWSDKCKYYYKEDQKMDSLQYADDYKDRYEAANFYLDKMVIE